MLAALWAGAAPGTTERPEDRWNLADLYPSAGAWAGDAARLEAQLKEFAACRERLGESARRFKACLDAQADFTKLPIHLQHSEDGGPYISASIDITRSLDGTKRNVGYRRMMLRGRTEARMAAERRIHSTDVG